ncbi:MAG: hypothetical protein ACW99Q_17940, partial [Candidatus Kariarchaeaceae archaeon]
MSDKHLGSNHLSADSKMRQRASVILVVILSFSSGYGISAFTRSSDLFYHDRTLSDSQIASELKDQFMELSNQIANEWRSKNLEKNFKLEIRINGDHIITDVVVKVQSSTDSVGSFTLNRVVTSDQETLNLIISDRLTNYTLESWLWGKFYVISQLQHRVLVDDSLIIQFKDD